MIKAQGMGLEERGNLFKCTTGFQRVSDFQPEKIALEPVARSIKLGEVVLFEGDPCKTYEGVADGLLKLHGITLRESDFSDNNAQMPAPRQFVADSRLKMTTHRPEGR